MALQYSENIIKTINRKYIFLDNDFLITFFKHEDLFIKIVSKLSKGQFALEPFTVIEFLRGIYQPNHRENRKKFIFNAKFFEIISNQYEILNRLQRNALLISRIYKHSASTKDIGTQCNPSVVDLILASRIMLHNKNSVLITGNIKDYAKSIFELVGSINYQTDGGTMKSFGVLMFNQTKFNEAYANLNRMK